MKVIYAYQYPLLTMACLLVPIVPAVELEEDANTPLCIYSSEIITLKRSGLHWRIQTM